MALINCPECGTEVSEKALACPKCAFPIQNSTIIKCPECGTEIRDKAVTCHKCAFPLNITEPPIESGSDKISESSPSPIKINRKWGHVSWITYLSIGLLFLLPFCDLSCSGRKVTSLSGIILVTGASISPTLLGTEIGESREIPANEWAILAFISAILGLLVSLSYIRSNILSGLLGLACAAFLVVLQVSINENLNNSAYTLFSASFTVAYWLALVAAVVIGIINFSTLPPGKMTINEVIELFVKMAIVVVIFVFIISRFDSTSPFQYRPTLSSLNSESSLFSFGPSPREIEEKRIADSIRVADSLAMVEAEQQRVADSISQNALSGNLKVDSIFQYAFSKQYRYYQIFTPSGKIDDNGVHDGNWSSKMRTVTVVDFNISNNGEIVLHKEGGIMKYNGITARNFKSSDNMFYVAFFAQSSKGNKKIIQYYENGELTIIDNNDFSGVSFTP